MNVLLVQSCWVDGAFWQRIRCCGAVRRSGPYEASDASGHRPLRLEGGAPRLVL